MIPTLSNALPISDKFMTRSVIDAIHFGQSDIFISNREMLEVMEMLGVISETMLNPAFLTVESKVVISNSIYVAEHRLASLNHWSLKGRGLDFDLTNDSRRLDVSEALGLAAQLYMHLGIRLVNVRAGRHRRVFRRLFAALPHDRSFADITGPRFHLCLLLWIFAIGAADYANQVVRRFFLKGLSDICGILLVYSAEDFEGCLREVLWIDPFSADLARNLWDDITLLWLHDIDDRGAFITPVDNVS
jgi:hypothetical protein